MECDDIVHHSRLIRVGNRAINTGEESHRKKKVKDPVGYSKDQAVADEFMSFLLLLSSLVLFGDVVLLLSQFPPSLSSCAIAPGATTASPLPAPLDLWTRLRASDPLADLLARFLCLCCCC